MVRETGVSSGTRSFHTSPFMRTKASPRGRAVSQLARLRVERTQATVAVGLERAHPELLGQGEGLAIVGLGLRA